MQTGQTGHKKCRTTANKTLSNHQTMETLPTLPDWVEVEHQVATLLTEQENHGWYFDVRSAQQLTASLQKNWKRLKKILDDDTLSSKERRKLLNAITKPKATSKAQLLPASKNLTQLRETT